MAEYITRFWIWNDRYLPGDTPDVVYFVATCIWVNHSQLYDTDVLSDKFDSVVDTFQDTESVIKWFKKQDKLWAPATTPGKSPRVNSSGQGSRQGQKRNFNIQGSTHKYQYPVPAANKDNSAHNTTSGNVNKNANNSAKKLRQKIQKLKAQTTQAASTDAGNHFADTAQEGILRQMQSLLPALTISMIC